MINLRPSFQFTKGAWPSGRIINGEKCFSGRILLICSEKKRRISKINFETFFYPTNPPIINSYGLRCLYRCQLKMAREWVRPKETPKRIRPSPSAMDCGRRQAHQIPYQKERIRACPGTSARLSSRCPLTSKSGKNAEPCSSRKLFWLWEGR